MIFIKFFNEIHFYQINLFKNWNNNFNKLTVNFKYFQTRCQILRKYNSNFKKRDCVNIERTAGGCNRRRVCSAIKRITLHNKMKSSWIQITVIVLFKIESSGIKIIFPKNGTLEFVTRIRKMLTKTGVNLNISRLQFFANALF